MEFTFWNNRWDFLGIRLKSMKIVLNEQIYTKYILQLWNFSIKFKIEMRNGLMR